MSTQGIIGLIDRQEWLGPVEENAQHAIQQGFESAGSPGRKIKNALHGTWLGHPLHVALTDIPIGAWTAAMVFDALEAFSGRTDLSTAADSAVALGIVGALGAAAAGLTDWQHTDPPARRIGLAHALLNVGGVVLFAGSFAARKRGARGLGRTLSVLGYAVATVSARLGGDLVYEHRIGVDHTAGQNFPDDFVPVLAESELPEGSLRRVGYKGTPILLAKRDQLIYALAETCSHLGGPLSEGEFIGKSVKCPWHGSRFALEDGRVLDGPAVHPQPCLLVRLRNGQIEVAKAVPACTTEIVNTSVSEGEVGPVSADYQPETTQG